MAGVEGLEPSPTVLETGMLPLHQTPMEHWVGVEPTNSGFADHSSTDGDPALIYSSYFNWHFTHKIDGIIKQAPRNPSSFVSPLQASIMVLYSPLLIQFIISLTASPISIYAFINTPIKLVRQAGIEPATHGLKVRYLTTWLLALIS